MTSVQEGLLAIQNTLKKCAEELGQLNIHNYDLLKANEELSLNIKRLQAKIAKKNHSIEQEAKDKQIIHQKLVRAEEVKEQLQIRITKVRERKEQAALKEQQEHEWRLSQERKAQQAKEKANKQDRTPKPSQPQEHHSNNQIAPKPKPMATTIPAPCLPKIEVPSSLPEKDKNFSNNQKGQYQPPALFLDEQKEESSDQESEQEQENEEGNSKMLQKMRQKLKKEKQQFDED